jgi:hypothetical protein
MRAESLGLGMHTPGRLSIVPKAAPALTDANTGIGVAVLLLCVECLRCVSSRSVASTDTANDETGARWGLPDGIGWLR